MKKLCCKMQLTVWNMKLTLEQKRKTLRDRAKKLARESSRDEMDEEYLEAVEFLLAYETYAIETTYIREVCPLDKLTPLPLTPPFVLGIINVRGQILSVIDVRKFFDLPEKGLTNLNRVIILHSSNMEFGVLADEILGVQSFPMSKIQPSLPTLTGIRAEYLKGITNDRVVILDGGKILSDEKIVVHEEI